MSSLASLWILFLFATMLCLADECLQTISFRTAASPGRSIGLHTYTAWVDQKVYQCQITPNLNNADYSCEPTLIGCDLTVAADEVKLLIDNAHVDASLYDNIVLTTDVATYTVTGVCIDETLVPGIAIGKYYIQRTGNDALCGSGLKHYRELCVDGETVGNTYSCWPPQQMIYFGGADTSTDTADWEDARRITISTTDCPCAKIGLCLPLKHACECRPACVDTDPFCNSLGFVQGILGSSYVAACPANEECCCSCQNCPDWVSVR